MVRYEERDVSMSRDNHRQLADRLGSSIVELPQVFADGLHIGVRTSQPRPELALRVAYPPWARFPLTLLSLICSYKMSTLVVVR